ncbi:Outer membrane protein beta-barrel domain-containing protein [Lutibacter agarilyticus]|uniref:Outer membrane protein beta-barrel domain-containing protein n=1 Tax=Lutibacter agarilyticus TaxID=1109740 RepID=A0A238XB70_9FLAO|nr:porin family protein [Lutibacter agarilyticus]SNR55119.1 Outer membrane protein beta-barrel domain-containing protein [Lutibacter agarilyticus]
MKKLWLTLIFLICVFSLSAQVENDTIDARYREDHIYVSLSYNLLNNKPDSERSSLFSGGFSLGYIYDMPINERRNVGIGVGFGYAYNSYSSSFLLDIEEERNLYETSRFKTQLVEIPIEFRWRTSTASDYSFWRIYGGVKISYLFHSKSIFMFEDETIELKNISELEKFQYGLILSAGYGSWNVFIYYGLNPLFNNVIVDNKKLNLKDFSLGLKFYIL